MSHMNYQSSYNERTAMAERRARALRNRHQLEDTSGRLQEKRVGPVLVSPLNEEPSTAKIASQRFEPAYLKPTESLVGSDYAGGSSQSSSWEEAEAEWASVSPDNNLNAGNAVEKKNTLPVATKSRSLNHTHIVDSEDYPVTDGEDSLLESEDESSYMGGRRPTKTRINHKHRQIRQFKKSTVNNPNVLVRDINALNLQPRPAADFQQQRAPISSINSQLPNASPYSAAVSPQDDNSINSNSIGQTPAPILRKTESYRTLESFRTLDTSVSGGASETDDDDSMPKSRRKVKFHETSRGELRNTVHEYEDDSLTAYTEKTEDTISTSNDGNFPSIMDANMEDALLDFFFLGQSAHPRPAKKKKVPPKSKNRGNKKNNSRCNDDDDESFDEDFGTSKTKNNGTSTKKSRSRRDAENEVEVSDDGDSIESLKNKYPTKSKKKGSTKKIVSYSDSKNKDEISVEDDATLESETVMSAYTNETGSSWSKGSVEDETTAASSVVSNKYPMKKRRNPPEKQNKEETGDDPFQMVDNFCQMVGNACGMIALSMPPINVDVRKKESSSQDDRSVVSTKSNDSLVVASRASNNKCSPFFDIDTDALSTAQSKVIVLAYQCQDWVEQTAGLKVAQTPPSEVVDPPTSPVEEFLEAKENKIEEEVDDEKALENGLLELVKCAARSRHLQQGFVFDESYDIDVTSEVKFVAISTSLPLGGMCFTVTFVFFFDALVAYLSPNLKCVFLIKYSRFQRKFRWMLCY